MVGLPYVFLSSCFFSYDVAIDLTHIWNAGVAGVAGWLKEVFRDDDNLPLEDLAPKQVKEALWRLQLARAAYVEDESKLRDALSDIAKWSGIGCRLQAFSRQDFYTWGHPQWFSCIRSSGEFVVTFRGTTSFSDVLADTRLFPKSFGHVQIHSGFAEAVRNAWFHGLQHALSKDVVRSSKSVILIGHSLGGALTLALLGLNLLPVHAGKYEVTTFGAPAVFYQTAPERSQLRHAKIEQWIMEEDPVPRVLGSDYAPLINASSRLLNRSGIVEKVNSTLARWFEGLPSSLKGSVELGSDLFSELLGSAQQQDGSHEVTRDIPSILANLGTSAVAYAKDYVHLEFAKHLWLRSGRAISLAPTSSSLRIRTLSAGGLTNHALASYDEGLRRLQNPQGISHDET